jgi:ribonuclease BN (tRNA processing enzyme)
MSRPTHPTLTVCGSAGTHPGAGRGCSGYLLTTAGGNLMLDLGNGSLPNLQQRIDVADIDAVLISHLHPDHFADVWGLYYALRFHPRGEQRVRILAPAGAPEHLGRILSDDSRPTFTTLCDIRDAAAGEVIEVAGCTLRLFAAEHPIETLAARVEVDGRVLAYTADSGPTPRLVECAQDADLLVADATWLERDRPLPEGIHMTGREAGQLAADAGVSRLLLSHILPTNDPEATAAEAAEVFDGEIVLATDLLELPL